MPENSWLPHIREDRLAMGFTWLEVLALKAAAFGVPPVHVTTLNSLCAEAQASLSVVKSPQKTAPAVAQCKADFKALVEEMRFIKKHYFLRPALDDPDFISLGLKIPVKGRGKWRRPIDLVKFVLSLIPTDHMVVAAFQRAGYKTRGKGRYHDAEVRYWVLPLDAPPPATTEEPGYVGEICTATPWSHTFKAKDIGMRVFLAMRWENPSSANDDAVSKGP
jgi:hypothetical protein